MLHFPLLLRMLQLYDGGEHRDKPHGHLPVRARPRTRERPGHRAPRMRFEPELEDRLSEEAAQETLNGVIAWGRYAELFSYDDQAELFSLENPSAADG